MSGDVKTERFTLRTVHARVRELEAIVGDLGIIHQDTAEHGAHGAIPPRFSKTEEAINEIKAELADVTAVVRAIQDRLPLGNMDALMLPSGDVAGVIYDDMPEHEPGVIFDDESAAVYAVEPAETPESEDGGGGGDDYDAPAVIEGRAHIHDRTGGWYDVLGIDGEPINKKALRLPDAIALHDSIEWPVDDILAPADPHRAA